MGHDANCREVINEVVNVKVSSASGYTGGRIFTRNYLLKICLCFN